MAKKIQSVAILGGGFMGAGIAESASIAELDVLIRELPDYIDAAKTRLEKSFGSAVKRGKLTEEQRDAALARIKFTSELTDVAGSDLVIEAVPENLKLKLSLFKGLNEIVSEDTLLSSNTSSIPIAELAPAVKNPGRVLGLHFFSPVPVMKLVEIVRALETSDDTITTAREFVSRLGKHPIETKDRAGFIVNFLLTPYLMGAVRMYEEGFASREDIDSGMRYGASHPMGPLQLCDFIGLDVLKAVCESLFEEFKRSEYATPPLMKRMIAAGHLGQKSGKGFYDYTKK
jgi:3-hydroxybutyryl-CoA dehydrogenase